MPAELRERRFRRSIDLKVWWVGLASVICCGLVTPAGAADGHYSNISPDQHLKDWLLLGPIPVTDSPDKVEADEVRKLGFEKDLLKVAGGEANVGPKLGDKLTTGGKECAWSSHDDKNDIINLADILGAKDFAVAYAAATIESPQAETRIVGLGSDDAVRVWLNGEMVHENAAARAVVVDNDVFSVKLKKGTNRLLIKVANDQGGWGFSFRFLSPEALSARLFQAASDGKLDLVEEIVSLGVDVDSKSPAGITAAQIAKVRGHERVVELLVSKGAASPQPFDATKVATAIIEQLASDDAPGVAVLVARDGKVLLSRGFGLADVGNDVPITPTTKFRIGSVTKQFAAASILKLQEEGKLSVDDKLSKFFPDFPRGDEVTIRHLLTHTSGIKSYTSKPDFLSTVTIPATKEQLIDSFKDDPFDFDPGSKMLYNNSGYFLLGAIIEKVSGETFNDYLRDTFFEPLGMHDTGVHSSSAVIKHEATGYGYEGGKLIKATNWDMSRAGAAGSLYSTVEDLMRWNEGVFGGKVLSEESLKSAFAPYKLDSGKEPTMSYGFGWAIGEHRGLKTIGHGGGLNGWSSGLTRYPDQNLTVVALHNAMPQKPGLSPDEVGNLAADLFLWQEMKPSPTYEEDKSIDAASFGKYVGRYDYMGAVMDVVLKDKQLTAQLTGQPRFPIFPYDKNRFFWRVTDAQIEFLLDDKGQVNAARHTQGGQTFVADRLAEERELQVDAEKLDRYVGKYEYPGIGVLTVRRDEDKLVAQMTGQPEFEIYAKAEDLFFWKVVAAEVRFVVGQDGKVEKAVHQQSGATIEAKKVE